MGTGKRKAGVYIAVWAAVLIWGCGCAFPPAGEKSRPEALEKKSAPPSKKAVSVSEPAANRYYYYLEAQLQKKRGNLGAAVEYLKSAIDADPDATLLKKDLAVLHLRQENYEKALRIIDQLLAVRPDSADLLLMKASVIQTIDPEADVEDLYKKVLSIDPKRKEVYQVLGKHYLDAGNKRAAADVFDRMLKHFPKAYVGHFYLGRIYSDLGRYKKARAAFKRTIELAPELNQPRWELIKLYQSHDPDKNGAEKSRAGAEDVRSKVVALYKEILEYNPENAAAAMELSLVYHASGRSSEADRILAELGRKSLEDASVIRTLMQRLVLEKRYGDALTVLDGMSAGAPASSGLQYAMGVVHYNKDQYQQAIKAFKAVSPESTFYLNAVIHRGIIAYQQENLEQAIEILKSGLDSADEAGKREIIPYLSSFYKQKGDLKTAEALLRQGLEIAPESTGLRFELGVLYDEQDKRDKALEQMQKVLDIEPDHADALNYIGYTWADQGVHLEKAEKMIRRALEQKPENGYIIDSLGWLYYRRGMYEKAADYIQKAARLIPDDPIVLEHLGDVYVKLGNPGKALEAYQRALEQKADNAEAIARKIKDLRKNGS